MVLPMKPPIAWLAAALALALAAPAAALPPPVQLVETRPIESALGNPSLPAAHEVWLEMIRGAGHSLDLEEFYLSQWPGEPTADLLEALGQAAGRGVRVRLILDRGMHDTYPMPADSLGRLPGIEVRVIDMKRIAGGIQHAKYFIVDGGEVFVGSQNFDWRALEHIHELGVRARDERLARAFGGVFAMDWAAADTTAPEPARAAAIQAAAADARAALGPLPLAIVQSPGDTVRLLPSWSPRRFIPDTSLWDRDVLLRVLDSARHEIALQLLTYSPAGRIERDSSLDLALRGAAARGVSVRMIVSDWEAGGPGMAALQSLARLPQVSVKLSTVPEWSGGYIPFARVEHCKYLVVDTLVTWVGTSNWEPSYFHASRNLAVTMWNRRLAAQAHAVFERSWRAPGARSVHPDSTYTAKAHGMASPSGGRVYGR